MTQNINNLLFYSDIICYTTIRTEIQLASNPIFFNEVCYLKSFEMIHLPCLIFFQFWIRQFSRLSGFCPKFYGNDVDGRHFLQSSFYRLCIALLCVLEGWFALGIPGHDVPVSCSFSCVWHVSSTQDRHVLSAHVWWVGFLWLTFSLPLTGPHCGFSFVSEDSVSLFVLVSVNNKWKLHSIEWQM